MTKLDQNGKVIWEHLCDDVIAQIALNGENIFLCGGLNGAKALDLEGTKIWEDISITNYNCVSSNTSDKSYFGNADKSIYSYDKDGKSNKLITATTPVKSILDKTTYVVYGCNDTVTSYDVVNSKALWNAAIGSYTNFITSNSTSLYCATDEARVVKLKEFDGTLVWNCAIEDHVNSVSVGNDGFLY